MIHGNKGFVKKLKFKEYIEPIDSWIQLHGVLSFTEMNLSTITLKDIWRLSKRSLYFCLKYFTVVVAIVLRYTYGNQITQFVFACIGLIPLAGNIGDSTEDLGDRINPIVGGLLNGSLGNVPELIFALISLFVGNGKLDELIKAALIGSIVSNTLLVLGSALIVGGLKNGTQKFVTGDIHGAGSTILLFAALCLAFPTIWTAWSGKPHIPMGFNLLDSCVLFVCYILYTIFQIKGSAEKQKEIQETDGVTIPLSVLKHNEQIVRKKIERARTLSKILHTPVSGSDLGQIPAEDNTLLQIIVNEGQEQVPGQVQGQVQGQVPEQVPGQVPGQILETQKKNDNMMASENDETEEKKSHIIWPILQLAVSSALIAILSDIITDTVSVFSESLGLSHTFIGMILISFLGNAAEHWTAIIASYHNETDLSVTTVLTSALQISMLIIPLIVMFSYIRSEPFELIFNPLELVALGAAVVCVWVIISDSRTNWLEGVVLTGAYIVSSTVFYYV